MAYNFKKFEGVHKRLEDRITITKSNAIGLPSKFYEDNKIKNYKYAVIFWDSDQMALGIHFTNDEAEKDKFTIIHSDNYGGQVLVKSFFKSLNIDPSKYRGRYDYKTEELPDIGKVYIIHLKEHQ